jgi:hypothetical protein
MIILSFFFSLALSRKSKAWDGAGSAPNSAAGLSTYTTMLLALVFCGPDCVLGGLRGDPGSSGGRGLRISEDPMRWLHEPGLQASGVVGHGGPASR